MTTALDIVTRAFRKVGISASDEVLQADEAANGIEALNMMLHGWRLRGVNLAHADLTTTSAFPLSPEFEEGTVYMLADRIGADYVAPRSFDADAWFRGIQAAYLTIPESSMPRALIDVPSTDDGLSEAL